MHPDMIGDVVELGRLDVLEALAAPVEFLVELDRLLLHAFVGGRRAAGQEEILPHRHALLAVAVEAEAQEQRAPLAGGWVFRFFVLRTS